ncbi:Ldh family oxidoreductase [Streptomyces mobaraensis]|uniref:Ldh family oxidoreductase n=1 Tax=Streptomyces mobaraensis TaxID=35621 RepID=UPI003331CC05
MVTRVPALELADYLERLYRAAGMSRGGARTMAASHVEADLRGIPGHGSRLAPAYLAKLRTGRLNPRPRVTARHEGAVWLALDADLAPGPVAARLAVTASVRRARRHGVGLVCIRRAGHAGALGIAASRAAQRGLVSVLAAPTSSASVALLSGTGTPLLGPAAFAVGVPGPDPGQPVVVDLAAASSSWGRVHQQARTGQDLPEGWALDAAGCPVRDPRQAAVLLPAGERGQALAIVLHLLLGALTGTAPLPTGAEGRGLLSLVLDPVLLGGSGLATAVDEVGRAVREQGARMPSDRAWAHRAAARRSGIELDDEDLAALVTAGLPHVRAPRGWPRPTPLPDLLGGTAVSTDTRTTASCSAVLDQLADADPMVLHQGPRRPQVARALHAVLDVGDPYPVVSAARRLCDGPLERALADVAEQRLLHEPTGRRVPLQELPSRVLTHLTRHHRLTGAQAEALHFALRCSFPFPGIVGTPHAPFALKAELPAGFTPVATPEEIAATQRAAGPDGLNTRYMISQMKGGMSCDFGVGCPLMCAYCYRREGDTVDGYLGSWEPTGFLGAEEVVQRLLAHPWFTPHVTPLGLHMSTSEAFLPKLWSRTWTALKLLDDLGLTNRVSCITKYGLSDEQIEQLESLVNIDLDINICYAAMPTAIEPPNRQRRLDFLRRALASDRLNVLAYYRPIAEGINTTDAHMRDVWTTFKDTDARTVVLGGLKFGDDHVHSFMSYGLPLPSGSFTPGKKLLSAATEQRIMAMFEEVYADVPAERRPAVVKRSSCGRSVERGSHLADYNGHYDLPATNCRLRCPAAQHQLCATATMPEEGTVRQLLARIGRPDARFDITASTVVVHADLSQFERTFLRQNALHPVHTARQAADLLAGRLSR